MNEELLTVREAAAFVGVTYETFMCGYKGRAGLTYKVWLGHPMFDPACPALIAWRDQVAERKAKGWGNYAAERAAS